MTTDTLYSNTQDPKPDDDSLDVDNPHEVTLTATVPTWSERPDPPLAIDSLEGAVQRGPNNARVVVAYKLKTRTAPQSLTVEVAGVDPGQPPTSGAFTDAGSIGADGVWKASTGANPSKNGIFTVVIPAPPPDASTSSIPVRFTGTFAEKDEQGVSKPVVRSVVKILTLPLFDPSDPTPRININSDGVTANDLPVDAVSVELVRALLAGRANIRINAPTTQP
jgi:hypothetical protein